MKDLFSKQANAYANFRPEYPEELYTFLLQHTHERNIAWDCGTGNGQVAKELSLYFREVFATDISRNQISLAPTLPNVHYTLQATESTDFPDQVFDLITVGQALHWFKFEQFFREVERVAKKGALFAAFGYELCHFEQKEIENAFLDFYHHKLNGYWQPERKHIENQYLDVPFPFQMLPLQTVRMTKNWLLYEFEGYLNSWSAVQTFVTQNGYNPVSHLIEEIQPFWAESRIESVYFPIFIRAGYIR